MGEFQDTEAWEGCFKWRKQGPGHQEEKVLITQVEASLDGEKSQVKGKYRD